MQEPSLEMLNYFIRRLGFVIFVAWGVTLFTFLIAQVVPADPALAALGDHATDEMIAAFRTRNGLDKPVWEQYGLYVTRLVQGDLGTSLRTGRKIVDDLAEFLPGTLELSIAGLLIAAILGIPAGVLAALKQNKLPDLLVRLLSLIAGATPVYWLAILLLEYLHNKLGWLPGPGRLDAYLISPTRITGMVGIDAIFARDGEVWVDALRHMILPAFVLGASSAALLARMTRSAMLETLSQDYVRTARAKGVSARVMTYKHAFRNAALPILTVLGGVLGGLLSGAVLTETIFSWPGIGRYATEAAISLDFPAVMGVTLVAGLAYSLINLLVDLLYATLDPRISYG
jgi:peptide/nickel transport system permease protein